MEGSLCPLKKNVMIQKTVFALLLSALAGSAGAQQQTPLSRYPEPGVQVGIKGGLSIASVIKTSDNSFSSTPLLGFHGGLELQLPLGRVLSIQPEVLFSQKGYRTPGTAFGNDYDYRRYLNCLDIPLLLRINASRAFGILIGPQYSYLLGTHTTFKTGNNTIVEDVNNNNGNIQKNLLGGVIGAEVQLDEHLFIYGRYSLDFRNNNGDGTSTTPSYKNQVLQFGLGILL